MVATITVPKEPIQASIPLYPILVSSLTPIMNQAPFDVVRENPFDT